MTPEPTPTLIHAIETALTYRYRTIHDHRPTPEWCNFCDAPWVDHDPECLAGDALHALRVLIAGTEATASPSLTPSTARSARQGDAEGAGLTPVWKAHEVRLVGLVAALLRIVHVSASHEQAVEIASEAIRDDDAEKKRQRAAAPEAASADAIETPNVATPAPTATTGTEDALRAEVARLEHSVAVSEALATRYFIDAQDTSVDAAALRAEVEGLRHDLTHARELRRLSEVEADELADELAAQVAGLLVVADAARDVCECAGIEMDDERLRYIVAQHDRGDWQALAAALAALPQPTKETT